MTSTELIQGLGIKSEQAPVAEAIADMSSVAVAERAAQIAHDYPDSVTETEEAMIHDAEKEARASVNGTVGKIGTLAANDADSPNAALLKWFVSDPDRRAELLEGQVPATLPVRQVSWWKHVIDDRASVSSSGSYDAAASRETRLFGLSDPVNFPFGFVSSQMIGPNVFLPAFANRGFDLLTTKTYRLRPSDDKRQPKDLFADPEIGYVRNRLFSIRRQLKRATDCGDPVVYATGKEPDKYRLSQVSPVRFAAVPSVFSAEMELEIRETLARLNDGQILAISICGDTVDDWRQIADICKQFKDRVVIEMNFSQRPDHQGMLTCERPGESAAAIKEVRAAVGSEMPIVAKISYLPIESTPSREWTLRSWFEECYEHLQGVTAIGGLKVIALQDARGDGLYFSDEDHMSQIGILSGALVQDYAFDTIATLHALRGEFNLKKGEFSIVANGGIYDHKGFARQLSAGADAAQSSSAAWVNRGLASMIRGARKEANSPSKVRATASVGSCRSDTPTHSRKRVSKKHFDKRRLLRSISTFGMSELFPESSSSPTADHARTGK